MKLRPTIFQAACILAILHPAFAISQSPQQVDASSTSCRGCSITLVKVATLGSADDDALPALAYNFVPSTNSKGEYFIPNLGLDKVVVYGRSGKLLRTIGRKGEGPGEYQAILHAETGADDSLFILSIGRLTVYSGVFSLVRTVPLAFTGYGAFIGLPSGDFVLDAGSANTAPQPLKFVSAAGKVTPVGPAVNVTAARCGRCPAYVVARAGSKGQFWTAGPNTYLIERRSAKGELLQQLQVANSKWFRNWSRAAPGNRELPPPTILHSLKEDVDGLLWALGDGPSPKWRPMPYMGETSTTGRARSNIPAGGAVAGVDYLERIYTVVEVIDPMNARLVVSTTFTGRRLKMVAPGLLAEPREDANGIGVLDIFRAEIKKP